MSDMPPARDNGPAPLPRCARVALAAVGPPAPDPASRSVWADVIPLSDDRVGLVVADTTSHGVPVTQLRRLVAEVLETAGADRLVAMDLHAGQLQGFFSKPVDHMTAMPILTQFVQDRLANRDLVIIAPDAGRVKLVRKFAQKVGAPYALMEKERPAQQVAEIGYVIGDVKDKTAVIVDDIIDTAGTLRAAADTVKHEGARCVFAAATHAVLSGNAYANIEAAGFEQVLVTDTIPVRGGAPDNIKVLSVADILTDTIRRIFTDDSVSEVFGGENQLF